MSYIASNFFSTDDGNLDVTHFVLYLSIAAGTAHLLGSLFLRIFPPTPISTPPDEEVVDTPVPVIHATEHTPLLTPPNKSLDPFDREQPLGELFRDPDFWLLAISMLLVLGSVRDADILQDYAI